MALSMDNSTAVPREADDVFIGPGLRNKRREDYINAKNWEEANRDDIRVSLAKLRRKTAADLADLAVRIDVAMGEE